MHIRNEMSVTDRLARDLHEDLGARVLNQLHRARDEHSAAESRALLGELRVLIDSLDPRPQSLRACVEQWSAEFREQCTQGSLRSAVQLPEVLPCRSLTPLQRSHPLRIVREFVDNALRHARPEVCHLQVRLEDDILSLECRHDGITTLPNQWNAARGLRNQQLRARDLEAKLSIHVESQIWVCLQLRFSLRGERL